MIERGVRTTNAGPRMPLDYYDTVTTSQDSTIDVGLHDNTKFSMVQSSTLVLDQGINGTQLRLRQGALGRILVTQGNRIEVLTPNGQVKVVGTLFDVIYTVGVVRPDYNGCPQYTDVIVHEGVVAVANPANPAVVVNIPAGYETTIACKQPPLNPGPIGITGAPAAGDAAFSGLVAGVRGSAQQTGQTLPSANVTAPIPVPALVQ
jgi:hypothetical protein